LPTGQIRLFRERRTGASIVFAAFTVTVMSAAAVASIGCNTTSGETPGAAGGRGGRGARNGGGGGGQAIHVDTAPLQHISIERRVDLSGTLVSPD